MTPEEMEEARARLWENLQKPAYISKIGVLEELVILLEQELTSSIRVVVREAGLLDRGYKLLPREYWRYFE